MRTKAEVLVQLQLGFSLVSVTCLCIELVGKCFKMHSELPDLALRCLKLSEVEILYHSGVIMFAYCIWVEKVANG